MTLDFTENEIKTLYEVLTSFRMEYDEYGRNNADRFSADDLESIYEIVNTLDEIIKKIESAENQTEDR